MKKGFTLVELILVIMMASVMVLLIAGLSAKHLSPRMEQFEVKRVVEVADKGGTYLVFTKDGNVYQNADAWPYGKFNSSDIQAQLDPGQCIRAKVTGYRVRLLSWYPNIVKTYPCEKD